MPSAGVRRSGPISRAKPGSASTRPGRSRPARVHRIEPDAGAAEASRPLADQRDLGALGTCVGARAVVGAAGILEIVKVEALGVLATRGHRDDARAGGPVEQRQQASDQRERPDDERGEGRLDPVGPDRAIGKDRPRVVDEHVEARLRGEHLVSGRPHRRERAHVRDDDRKAIHAVPRDERVADGGQPFLVAAHEHDPRAERRELIGDLTSEPGCRAGDQHGAAGKHVRRAAAPNRSGDAARRGRSSRSCRRR